MVGMSKFGEYLRRIRKLKGLTLTKLEELSGVSNSYLSQVENGQFKPSVEILKKLAKVLDVPYIELLQKAGVLEEDIVDGENELLKENIRLNEENRKLREVIKNMQNLISDSFD